MYTITTTDDRRAALWFRLFGLDTLPVKVAHPRLRLDERAGGEVLAYDLDAASLHEMAVARFAGHIARVQGIPYTDALDQVDGWPIIVNDDLVVETDTAVSDDTAVSVWGKLCTLYGKTFRLLAALSIAPRTDRFGEAVIEAPP